MAQQGSSQNSSNRFGSLDEQKQRNMPINKGVKPIPQKKNNDDLGEMPARDVGSREGQTPNKDRNNVSQLNPKDKTRTDNQVGWSPEDDDEAEKNRADIDEDRLNDPYKH